MVNNIIEQNKLCAIPIKLNEDINYHSTNLRDKVKNGESIIEETNELIEKFIKENNIYE